MGITSYAQNFEDVLLWRALGHIKQGFYIDVGAQHPLLDSVSRAFYERGWRGMHIEATPAYAAMLREDRPEETVFERAVSDSRGTMPFFEIPETGLSTGDKGIAEEHANNGYTVTEIHVQCITLADVFEQAGNRDIHWLKIDVEGMEAKALAGWGEAVARPWILVIESTYPNTQRATHESWQDTVLSRGYQEAYFDGLSRFYVFKEREELLPHFRAPPNIFDGFELATTAPYNAGVRRTLAERDQQHNRALREERAQRRTEQQENEGALAAARKEVAELKAKLDKIAFQSQAEEDLLRRERALRERISALEGDCRELTEALRMQESDRARRQKEVDVQVAEQARLFTARENELLLKLANREHVHDEKMRELTRELERVRDESSRDIAKLEMEMRQQVKSERAEQTRLLREHRVAQEALEHRNAKLIDDLRHEYGLRIQDADERLKGLANQLTLRDQELTRARAEHAQTVREHQNSIARLGAQHDYQLQKQAKSARQETQRLAAAWRDREKQLLQRLAKAERGIHEAETAAASQIAEQERRFAQELVAQNKEYQERLETSIRERNEAEAILKGELSRLRAQLHDFAARHLEISERQGQELYLQRDRMLEMGRQQAEREEHLRSELLAEQETSARIRLALAATQYELYKTPAFVWRRRSASITNATLGTAEFNREAALGMWMVNQENAAFARNSAEIIGSLSMCTSVGASVKAKSLAELLACSDHVFVRSAYTAILGRSPDPEGFTYYLARIRIGHSKLQILSDLRNSEEGKRQQLSLPGLNTAVRRYQRSSLPLIGRFYQAFYGIEGNRPIERQLRALGNEMQRIQESLTGMNSPLRTRESIEQSGATVSGAHPNNDELDQLPKSARRIYLELKDAAAKYSGK